MSKHLIGGGCKVTPLNLPDSCEASLATEDVLESIKTLRFFSPSLAFLVTTTACLGCRACRMIAEASLWVAPFRDFPLMDSTSSPFWIVPSWDASPLGNTLWTYWRAQSAHTHKRKEEKKDKSIDHSVNTFHRAHFSFFARNKLLLVCFRTEGWINWYREVLLGTALLKQIGNLLCPSIRWPRPCGPWHVPSLWCLLTSHCSASGRKKAWSWSLASRCLTCPHVHLIPPDHPAWSSRSMSIRCWLLSAEGCVLFCLGLQNCWGHHCLSPGEGSSVHKDPVFTPWFFWLSVQLSTLVVPEPTSVVEKQ